MQADREGRRPAEIASGDGVAKAMVLKQYVDFTKKILCKPYTKGSEEDFLEWFSPMSEKFALTKEKENFERLVKTLQEGTL